MAKVSLEVPAWLTGPVRESVLLLYDATAESLHRELRAHAEGRAALAEVRVHRTRLSSLGELLDRLAWEEPATAASPTAGTRLSGPADVLHDALYGALIDAGERLAIACERCWRGELPRDRVEVAGREVIALDGLLRRVREAREAAPP